ncbi:MAG: hypothetical protein BWZ02_02201 [Lentisphaerae bacterium ADurb.BinA184]|nr:MAG: hypothetical protein BWZ02_02201 [Lentisphaerae bacterium ADurb.BinA184]
MASARPPNTSQLARQPSGPNRRPSAGTRGPATIRPRLDPATAMPAATPRRLLANQAATSPMAGTLAAAPPSPAKKRPAHTGTYPRASPVPAMASPMVKSATATTRRGPRCAESAPAATTAIRYPSRFHDCITPVCSCVSPRCRCISGRIMV